MLRDDELAQRIEDDWQTAGLSQKREAMLRYSLKLTESPVDMVRADVDALREVGFGDAEILAIAELVGYYAYVNRIADGLGVELEEDSGESLE